MTEKLYYENTYTKTFAARVVNCEPAGEGRWHVILDRTAFYPEGGGQPCDTGVLGFTDVIDVQEKGEEIVHTVTRALPMGALVTGGVNWCRRFRFMQQHTGEHIVSGIENRFFGGDNVGFHMGEKFLTVDWSKSLDETQLSLVERMANEAVYRDLPVCAEFPPEDKLRAMSYRSKKELTGAVRIVTVPGYDICACCGTHVARTGEIGAIKLLGSQSYKGGTRIFMACGAQAMDDFSEKQKNVAAVSALLSAKPEEIAQAVERMLDENADLKRRLAAARGRLLELKAASVPENSGCVCVFEDDLAPEDLRRCALLVAERCGGTAAVFSGGEGVFRYALANTKEDVRPVGKELNSALCGRGGGSKELVQGSLKGERHAIESFFVALHKKVGIK